MRQVANRLTRPPARLYNASQSWSPHRWSLSPRMDYLSFDLRIGEWNPHTQTGVVEVLHSPSGEGRRYPFALDLDVSGVLRELARTPSRARHLGRQLSEAIFRQDVLLAWYESYQIARERQCGLRLRLHVESFDLSRLPWELVYDARSDDFLVFDERISIVRYIRLHTAPPSLRQSASLRLLAVAASPVDEAPLDWRNEIALLQEAVAPLAKDGLVELHVCQHATRESLHVALLEHQPDVVHFVGHAEYDVTEQQGYLVLEDERHRSAYVDATEMARLLRRYGTHLVVLNACETARGIWAGLAPTLVRCEIPAVVAMQWPIEDRAAIGFSKAFYRTLAAGRTVDECVAEGRIAMDTAMPRTACWAAPVLFLRSHSGQIWRRRPSAAAAQRRREQPKPVTRARPDGPRPELFKTRGPLRLPDDQDVLVERPALRRILRLAQQPTVTQYIALLSARQTGKTTLLLQLMDLLEDIYACVFIDLSVLRGQDVHACFHFVAFRLLSELRILLGDGAPLPDSAPVESSVEFLEFLYSLARIVPMPRIVLLVDEVGALSPKVSDQFFNTIRTVFTQGRGMTSALAKFLFIFSGAVDLYGLTFGTNSPLNICEKIHLDDFESEQVAQIVSLFALLNVPVAPEAPAAIYALTAGHPYLTMRLCALMEDAGVDQVTVGRVRWAASQLLVEDDNIGHLLRELEKMTAGRRLLYDIAIEKRSVPFSRNNPILASLEMIGAIRPTQPAAVRNRLYARALDDYYDGQKPTRSGDGAADASRAALCEQLVRLRAQALDARERYGPNAATAEFMAAFFSAVPALSPYPDLSNDGHEDRFVLAIDDQSPGGGYWNSFQPGILARYQPPGQDPATWPDAVIAGASELNLWLVFVLTTSDHQVVRSLSGTRDGVSVVFVADEEIAQLLENKGDIEAFLRERVLAARLRRL